MLNLSRHGCPTGLFLQPVNPPPENFYFLFVSRLLYGLLLAAQFPYFSLDGAYVGARLPLFLIHNSFGFLDGGNKLTFVHCMYADDPFKA